jgi:hypothetical protein
VRQYYNLEELWMIPQPKKRKAAKGEEVKQAAR